MRIRNCRNSHDAEVQYIHGVARAIELHIDRPFQPSAAHVRSGSVAGAIMREWADTATMDPDDLVTGWRLHYAGGRRYVAKLRNEGISDITERATPRKIK